MKKLYSKLDLTRICVMLGDACDFKCRHCIMKEVHTGVKKQVSEKLIKFLQEICDLHPNFAQNRRELVKISFWGGEPLLYFPVIKEIVERVNRPNAEYSIVTNGKRLNDEHVDFFNSLDRGVVFLSNDGPDTAKVRDENMLDSQAFCDTFNAIKCRGIDSVIHAYNQDYYRLWDYIDEKCGQIPIAHEFLEVNWKMPSDLYRMDLNAYKASCEKAAMNCQKKILAGELDSREFELFDRNIALIQKWVETNEKGEEMNLYPLCGPYHYSAHIDLNGGLYTCHSGFGKLGYIQDKFDFYDTLQKCENLLADFDKLREKPCETCPALPLCKKGCPFVLGNIKGSETMCEARRIFCNAAMQMVASFENIYTEVKL